MKIVDMGPLDEVFSHVDDVTGETHHFNITAMAHSWKVRTRPTVQVPVDPDVVQYFLEKRGIEQHRVERLIGGRVETPILILHWPDGRHLVVDGHHRYVASGLSGATEIPAKMIPRSIWKQFVIEDLPDETSRSVTKGISGIG
jgi:hypothetical protein